jgi:hypothetical protein
MKVLMFNRIRFRIISEMDLRKVSLQKMPRYYFCRRLQLIWINCNLTSLVLALKKIKKGFPANRSARMVLQLLQIFT